MAYSPEYLKYLEDQLMEFGPFETKKMFGGIGFFRDGLMFGLLGKNRLHLKADEQTIEDYKNAGRKNFGSSDKKKGMPYWEVPDEVLNDRAELAKWATLAFEVALRAKK